MSTNDDLTNDDDGADDLEAALRRLEELAKQEPEAFGEFLREYFGVRI